VPADPAVEAVIEATILMSGLAFESGGLSIAHALQRGFSAIPALSGWLHGELVALGLLVQLAAANSPDLVPIRSLCGRLGLPTSPNDIGCTTHDLALIADTTLQKAPYVRNFSRSISARMLKEAMALLDEKI
jgi:glycerol dehydrogenase